MSNERVLEKFAENQFNREKMRDYLPKPVFRAWQEACEKERPINREVADAIAHAMKTWAIERGATHFCHWFQPLNGKTAEKHSSFLQKGEDGRPMDRFSGKSLLQGETDGSSFPNGGLRDTFEARGYTFWDITSYAFVRGNILYIPSVFISYNGQKLDLKLPLIKSIRALDKEACRVLRLMGKEVDFVKPMLGLEQEYFLLDRKKADKRPDIKFCKRVLFSSDIPKGGEYDQTYAGRINPRVQAFMNDVNEECWKLGIYADIEHNEVGPGQYEFSSTFDESVTTIDQNMQVMDILERVALQHDMVCLLHEKPFSGMSGSGKHNNFSLLTSTGDNLFDPGDHQPEDLQFLVFIAAFIMACDRHQVLLRMVSSCEGNDHRLGGFEAPPTITSVYLGAPLHKLFMNLVETTDISPVELTTYIEPIINLAGQKVEATDRNRTIPISFTGNKFEFRMLGSSQNASFLNTAIYAAMAQALREIGDDLEAAHAHSAGDLHRVVLEIVHQIAVAHARILFDGDAYTEAWVEEADKRKLYRSDNYIDTVPILTDPQTVALLEPFDILNRVELKARQDILTREFIHLVKIQARILTRMASQKVYPALADYQLTLDRLAEGERAHSARRRADLNARFMDEIDALSLDLEKLTNEIIQEESDRQICRDMVEVLRPKMEELVRLLEKVELNTPYQVYPYPGEEDLVVQ